MGKTLLIMMRKLRIYSHNIPICHTVVFATVIRLYFIF